MARELEVVMERLRRIEDQDRFLKRLVTALLLGIVASVAILLGTPKAASIVEAREFILRDSTGNVRARWTANPEGGSALHLLDQEGTTRATLSVTSEGAAALALTDRQERSLAGMSVSQEGPTLALYDASGEPVFTRP